MVKYSRQREGILRNLQSRRDHPTADMIYDSVRKEYPNISLGTVYRNLTLLSELGEIQRLRLGDGTDHFDADTSPHNHFICNHCKAVIDLEMESIDSIDKVAAAGFQGEIEGHVTYFYGSCPACAEHSQIS